MLEVEPIRHRGHMATGSGQNVLEVEKVRRQYLKNQA